MTRIVGGWITPAKPGPTRRDVLLLVGAAALLFLLWSLFGTGWLINRGDDDKRIREVVLQLEQDGEITATTANGDASEATWPIEVRSRAGVRFYVARSRGDVTNADGPLRISVDVPPGVAQSAPTLRVLAPGHRVRLRRDKDEVPTALVDDFTPGDELTVMVTLPARQLRGLREADPDGELDAVTRPFDEAIEDNRDDQAKLRRLRGDAWWLALLGTVITALVPLLLWRRARLDFLRIGAIPVASKKLPTGPPGTGHAVDAAVLTRGTRGVDPASAFAGHVLDMVGREQVRLRRTLDPREGSGVRFGIAAATALEADAEQHPLDRPAIELLSTISDDGESAVIADSLSRLAIRFDDPRVDPARQAWWDAVEAHLPTLGYIEEPRRRRIQIVALAAAVLALLALIMLLTRLGQPGAVAAWSLLLAGALSLFVAFGTWERSTRRWRRVAPLRLQARARWLDWRARLDDAEAPRADVRAVPYAAASGSVARVAVEQASPEAVGLNAVTPATVEALRQLGGAQD